LADLIDLSILLPSDEASAPASNYGVNGLQILHIFRAKRSFVFVERQQHGQAVGILLWTRIRFYDVKQV
jgi:hypothetical protein